MKLDLTKPMRLIRPPATEVTYIGTLKSGQLLFDINQNYALAYRTNEVDEYIENIPERVVRWYALLIPQGGYHTLEELQRDCPSAQAIRCEFEGERAVDVAIEDAT